MNQTSCIPTFETLGQNEAALNEVKGFLLEVLVGSELVKGKSAELSWLQGLSGQYHDLIRIYQQWLQFHSPNLYRDLPQIAKEIGRYYFEHHRNGPVNVMLISRQEELKQQWKEADLLISYPNECVPLSLKFCKKGAYVNTKSAGLSSFIQQYFSSYRSASLQQQAFLKQAQLSYYKMATKLHADFDLSYQGDFNRWRELGHPTLPGQLPVESRVHLKEHYHFLASKLSAILEGFYRSDPSIFRLSLSRLLGFSLPEIEQIVCYYKKSNHNYRERYEVDHLDYLRTPAKEELDFEWQHPSEGQGHFCLLFKTSIFQVRIKPMNRFDTFSYKINCSYRTDRLG